MTPTEELRRLLDERREPWIGEDDCTTEWALDYDPHMAVEDIMGTLHVTGLTPEMAVTATLGERTAKAVVTTSGATGTCKCGLCGKRIEPRDAYCRHCGTRIVEVDGWS